MPATLSVAAFFRDMRAQGGAARLTQAAAEALLDTFFRSFGFELCGADQMLAVADLAIRARDTDVARRTLERVLDIPDKAHLAAYRLARLDVTAKRHRDAVTRFEAGARTWPDFPYNWMGLARALHALGRRDEAAHAAERFAGFAVQPHAKEELAVLADLADMLFEAGERRRSGPIYAVLQAFASPEAKVAVRHAEALIAAGDSLQALSVLRAAEMVVPLDPWGRRALAFCENEAGRHQVALAIAEGALAERPSDPGFLATYLDILVRSCGEATWRDARLRLRDILPADARCEIEARLLLAGGMPLEAAALLETADLSPNGRLYYLALETAYGAIDLGDMPRARALAARLHHWAGNELATILLWTNLALHDQLWEQAAEALARIPAEHRSLPEVRLKWFEHACFTGDTALAHRLQADMESEGALPRDSVLPVLRFLAEQQEWDEVARRALAWLGGDFRFAQIGYVLFRAARRSGRRVDFVAAIEAIEGWRDSPDLGRLHTALAWDGAVSLAEMERIATHAPASTAMRHRMTVQRRVMARARQPEGARALFLCTDAAYLPATIVALHSALEQSSPGREDVFVVVDDALEALAVRLVQPFREAGFQVAIVPARDVVGEAERLEPAYGLFTSGHLLASAAYYRIYFARHLQRQGRYTRAVYLDSDVLVRRPLDALFATELAGHPLAARVEMPRPEVTRALALHGLREGCYFNSGVLLFDLTSDSLPRALDNAIAAIADEGVTLLFHDQCALNLGFRDGFDTLRMAWNMPVSERTALADLPEEAAILHYLDRPKPWSPAYDGPCATLWFEQWDRTAAVIGAEAAVDLLAMGGD